MTSARIALIAVAFSASGSLPVERICDSIASSGFASASIGPAASATVLPTPPMALEMPLNAPPTMPPTAVESM